MEVVARGSPPPHSPDSGWEGTGGWRMAVVAAAAPGAGEPLVLSGGRVEGR